MRRDGGAGRMESGKGGPKIIEKGSNPEHYSTVLGLGHVIGSQFKTGEIEYA